MNWGVKNGDVRGGHCYTNSHTVSESNNHISIDSAKKSNENNHNISEIEDTGLQDGLGIDVMLPESTIHQCANIEYNNEYNNPLVNGKM